MATNNAINGPIPWKVVEVVSGTPPANQFTMLPFHSYIVTEIVAENVPTFKILNARLGDQYRLTSYGTDSVGFIVNCQGAQRLWFNADGPTVLQTYSFPDPAPATSITIICIDASTNAEQFMVDVGTGVIEGYTP